MKRMFDRINNKLVLLNDATAFAKFEETTLFFRNRAKCGYIINMGKTEYAC